MSHDALQRSASLSRRALLATGGWLASAAALLGVSGQPTHTARARASGQGLEGLWAVTVEEEDTPSVLLTFLADGSMVGCSNRLTATTIRS